MTKEEMRDVRIHRRAKRMTNGATKALKKNIDQFKEDVIIRNFENSENLTYADLKHINGPMRKKLRDRVLKKNQEVDKKIAETYNFMDIVVDNTEGAKMAYEDLKDEWQEVNEEITEGLKKKIEQPKQLNTRFQLFDIVDMDPEAKKCWACAKGLKCPKHNLNR